MHYLDCAARATEVTGAVMFREIEPRIWLNSKAVSNLSDSRIVTSFGVRVWVQKNLKPFFTNSPLLLLWEK